ncbi:MAG: hypothetical protein ACYS0K_12810 [Planctomycetota bacterium]|jgi:hypothetical protein
MTTLWLVCLVAAPELVARDVSGPVTGLELDAVRHAVVWSEGGIGSWRIRVAARDEHGKWATHVVAKIEQGPDPVPRLRRLPGGRLLVVWGGSADEPGGGWSVRASGKWSPPRALHEKCEGGTAHGRGDEVVCIRPVKRLDLRKVAGDFLHDPPRQGYAKPAVVRLSDGRELRVFEKKNLYRCVLPRAAGPHLVYFRQKDQGDAELVYVDVSRDDAPEVISRSSAFRFGREAALTVLKGVPVVAYVEPQGLVVRRRVKGRWGAPRVVVPGHPHGFRLAAGGDTLHLVATTPGDFRILYVRGDDPPRHVATGGGCALALHDGVPVLFWSDVTQRVDVTRARHHIRMGALTRP